MVFMSVILELHGKPQVSTSRSTVYGFNTNHTISLCCFLFLIRLDVMKCHTFVSKIQLLSYEKYQYKYSMVVVKPVAMSLMTVNSRYRVWSPV